MTGDRCIAAGSSRDPALTTGLLRWFRGAVVGLAETGLAVTGHVAGGGRQPDPLAAAALVAASVLCCVALSGRRWTLAPLVTVLVGGQIAFHLVMTASVGASPAAHAAPHDMTRHADGWQMPLAHIVASLFTALLLRHGEAWCWRFLLLLARGSAVVRLLTASPITARPRPARIVHVWPRWRARVLAHCMQRRGPPLAAAR